MSQYRRTFSAEAEVILARARAAQGLDHPVVKGDAVEHLIGDFLSSVLPERYQISSGIAIGSGSMASGQIDIIIHDREMGTYVRL